MNRFLKIGLVLGAIGLITIGIVFLTPWGNAESVVEKSEVDPSAETVETANDIVLNDMSEITGEYVSQESLSKVTSEIMFHITGPQDATGSFKQFTINFNSDKDYKKASISVVIDPLSVYTANKMRDESIKGEGFFESKNFPEIIFNSSQIEIGDTSYTATGTLFMLGVEKEITVNFMYEGKGENEEGNPIIIFQGEFTLDRTEHGMEETSGIGNNVEVSFYTELVEKE
jgi:polyisoprenoid-binding protein YceI